VRLQDAPAQEAISETPAIGGTTAQRLSRALGAPVGTDDEGNATVDFPAPGEQPFVPFSTAPRTVSREGWWSQVTDFFGGGSQPASDGAPPPPSSPDGPPPPAAAPPVDVDELAETVIERLRRELLIEREQSGGAMDLL